ncbi:hypothetical protein EON63_20220 [archaeon]|nr:MAG: hypothetical protein EON63_20220 [archaeon]
MCCILTHIYIHIHSGYLNILTRLSSMQFRQCDFYIVSSIIDTRWFTYIQGCTYTYNTNLLTHTHTHTSKEDEYLNILTQFVFNAIQTM